MLCEIKLLPVNLQPFTEAIGWKPKAYFDKKFSARERNL